MLAVRQGEMQHIIHFDLFVLPVDENVIQPSTGVSILACDWL